MKPVCGSGSVGAHKVNTMEQAEADWFSGEHDYIIQELMTGGDCDADVYVDAISHKAVAAFSKRKIETRIGGASKTISYKDPKLFAFIEKIASVFKFCGPLDMDFFIKRRSVLFIRSESAFRWCLSACIWGGCRFLPSDLEQYEWDRK